MIRNAASGAVSGLPLQGRVPVFSAAFVLLPVPAPAGPPATGPDTAGATDPDGRITSCVFGGGYEVRVPGPSAEGGVRRMRADARATSETVLRNRGDIGHEASGNRR